MILSNKFYDALKWIALIALDAIGLCYETVAGIWKLPYGNEIHSTCTAIAICLGALLQISSAQYKKQNAIQDN